ncbi:hypothetical protein MTO96_002400 [Rhipicephalus appendiculatus]
MVRVAHAASSANCSFEDRGYFISHGVECDDAPSRRGIYIPAGLGPAVLSASSKRRKRLSSGGVRMRSVLTLDVFRISWRPSLAAIQVRLSNIETGSLC